MIVNFLFQAFLLAALPSTTIDEASFVQTAQEVSAATEQMEAITGYDEYTARSFSHSLPVIGQSGFGPRRIDTGSLGVLTSADSVLVIDRRTAKVLYEKSSEEVRPIASITKLMTALTLLDQDINFENAATINPLDKQEGGKVQVYLGERFTLQDLWMDGLIASDNVAILALVRNSGLSWEDFMARMNELAKEYGMENSHFVGPTGISRYNVSTAKDLAILIDRAMSEPKIADTLRRPTYSFKPINKDVTRTVKNTNILLNTYINEDPYTILGGKTGFTYEAGYCLGVIVDGPHANDDLIVVVLGADTIDSRFQEVKGLVDWTYNNFEW